MKEKEENVKMKKIDRKSTKDETRQTGRRETKVVWHMMKIGLDRLIFKL